MKIEQFIALSEGEWRSMRSGHSIAFKQFEQVISKLTVTILNHDDLKVKDLLSTTSNSNRNYISPFHIKWEVEDEWEHNNSLQESSGSSILIPIPETSTSGLLIRSIGYTEPIPSLSTYTFLSDGTFTLSTEYEKTVTEERIWFLSKSVRCRSSVVYIGKKSGIVQTSFASEIRMQSNFNTK